MATDRLVLRSSDPTRVEFAYSTLPRNVLIFLNVFALYIYVLFCFLSHAWYAHQPPET